LICRRRRNHWNSHNCAGRWALQAASAISAGADGSSVCVWTYTQRQLRWAESRRKSIARGRSMEFISSSTFDFDLCEFLLAWFAIFAYIDENDISSHVAW